MNLTATKIKRGTDTWRYVCPNCVSVEIRWQHKAQNYWCKFCGARFLRPIDKNIFKEPRKETQRMIDSLSITYNVMFMGKGTKEYYKR